MSGDDALPRRLVYEQLMFGELQTLRRSATRTAKAHMTRQSELRTYAEKASAINAVFGAFAAVSAALVGTPGVAAAFARSPSRFSIASVMWAVGFYGSKHANEHFTQQEARCQRASAKWMSLQSGCAGAQTKLTTAFIDTSLSTHEAVAQVQQLQDQKAELDKDSDSITHPRAYQASKKNSDEATDKEMAQLAAVLAQRKTQLRLEIEPFVLAPAAATSRE